MGQRYQVAHRLLRHIFGQKIRWIHITYNFMQGRVSRFETLLDPKIGNGDVPHFAQAAATANANRRGSIRKDLQWQVEAQLSRQALSSKAIAGAFHDAYELGLTGR